MPKYCVVATHSYLNTYEDEWSDSTNPSYVGDLCLGEVEAKSSKEVLSKVIPRNDFLYAEDFKVYKIKGTKTYKQKAYFGYLVDNDNIVIPYKALTSTYDCYALIRDAEHYVTSNSIPVPNIVIDLKDATITVRDFYKLLDVKNENFPKNLPSYWWKKYVVDFINPPNTEIDKEIKRWKLAKV